MKIKIGLVDDHRLFLKSLSLLLQALEHFSVVIEASNGIDLQKKLQSTDKDQLPDIILIDVNMPEMGGVETAAWLSANHPEILLIALSMNDKDRSIIKMFRAGCSAYLLKDIHPAELERALIETKEKGFYNSDVANINFRRLLNPVNDIVLSEKEQIFLQYACSDFTYKYIAGQMNLSERTIDGYRESLFQKFKVQSRVGLCLEALRKEFVSL